MEYGTPIKFIYEGKNLNGMFLRSISWEDSDAYYEIQLPNGNRITIPSSTDLIVEENETGIYPGSDCQV